MKISSAVLATMLAASGAAAQQPINQTIPTAATGTVEIQNVSGEVRVIAWDRPEIRITGRLGEGTERLAVEGDRSRTVVRVVIPRNARDVKGTELEIRLPARKNVTVRTVSADIGVQGVTGAVDGRATSGDVQISGSPSRVTAGSTSGDVTVNASTTQVRASSTSGDLRVSGRVQQSVSAEAVSGDVTVDATAPDVVARSVSGDLQLTGASRRVTATTVSGDARVRTGRIQYGSFESVSGTFHFEGDLQRDAAFNVKSHSGDVELVLPSRIAASFQIDTFSGDISNAFGPAAQRTGGDGRKELHLSTGRGGPAITAKELHFSTGSGGPLITIKTFSGSVRLVRQ